MQAANFPFDGHVVSVATGDHFTCAASAQPSAVRCWGLNREGQLGLGFANNSVKEPRLVREVDLGPGRFVKQVCLLKKLARNMMSYSNYAS